MRSTVEYHGGSTSTPTAIVIDAYPYRATVSGTGEVSLRNINGTHFVNLTPIEARHFAAQLLAAADVAAS